MRNKVISNVIGTISIPIGSINIDPTAIKIDIHSDVTPKFITIISKELERIMSNLKIPKEITVPITENGSLDLTNSSINFMMEKKMKASVTHTTQPFESPRIKWNYMKKKDRDQSIFNAIEYLERAFKEPSFRNIATLLGVHSSALRGYVSGKNFPIVFVKGDKMIEYRKGLIRRAVDHLLASQVKPTLPSVQDLLGPKLNVTSWAYNHGIDLKELGIIVELSSQEKNNKWKLMNTTEKLEFINITIKNLTKSFSEPSIPVIAETIGVKKSILHYFFKRHRLAIIPLRGSKVIAYRKNLIQRLVQDLKEKNLSPTLEQLQLTIGFNLDIKAWAYNHKVDLEKLGVILSYKYGLIQ